MDSFSKTPLRISLFGGGSDYPAWFKHHGGISIGATIDKYCYWSTSPQENLGKICSSKRTDLKKILNHLNIPETPFYTNDSHYLGQGLGASSSSVIGFLKLFKNYFQKKNQLIDKAIFIEQNILNKTTGIQDQVLIGTEGLNKVNILKDGRYEASSIFLTKEQINYLNSHLLLLRTPSFRPQGFFPENYISDTYHQKTEIHELVSLAEEAFQEFSHFTDIKPIAKLLNSSWEIKKQVSSKISSKSIDDLYELALKKGAYAGKLLGAGGGGHLLLLVPPEKHKYLREEMNHFIFSPIKINSHR